MAAQAKPPNLEKEIIKAAKSGAASRVKDTHRARREAYLKPGCRWIHAITLRNLEGTSKRC